MFSLTSEQIGAIVRTVIQLASGMAIAKGIGDETLWLSISSGAVALASGIWSLLWIKKASTK